MLDICSSFLRDRGSGKDGSADYFWDLGEAAVTTGCKSVHPIGRPVIHSAKQGLRKTIISTEGSVSDVEQIRRATLPPRSRRARTEALEQSFHSLAGRVGSNPDSLATLGDASEGAGQNLPFRIIPERGKAPEYAVKSAPEQIADVFDDDELRPDLLDKPFVLAPQSAELAGDAGANAVAVAGDRNVPAGEASDDGVGLNSISGQSVGCKIVDVFIDRRLRPVLRQDAPAVRVEFAEGDRPEAGALKAEVE